MKIDFKFKDIHNCEAVVLCLHRFSFLERDDEICGRRIGDQII